MQTVKLTIAYDGSDFHGWQLQPGLATIQGALHDAIRQITQEPITIHGASRTDAGVHALGQVAHFKTHSTLDAQEIQRGLNALLPPTIRIVAAQEVGQDFHARWLAQGKTYRYRIYRGEVLPPFDYRRAFHYPWPLDEVAMSVAARAFEGQHDFSSFAASTGSEEDDKDRDMQRLIHSSEIVRDHELTGPRRNGLRRPRPFLPSLHGPKNRRHPDRSRQRAPSAHRYSRNFRSPRPLPLRPHSPP